MLPIISNTETLTMSSLDFLNNFINPARLQAGESQVESRHFVARIEDEIDDLPNRKNFTHRVGNRDYMVTGYDLTHEQMLLMGMRESKAVRKSVLSRLRELESNQSPKLPQTFAEALQLAADQAKQLELAAPKVAFVDKLVERDTLMTATQVAQKHGKSAKWLNKVLMEHDVYSKSVRRSKVFRQWFIDKQFGECKQSETGFSQSLFTPKGELWISKLITAHGYA